MKIRLLENLKLEDVNLIIETIKILDKHVERINNNYRKISDYFYNTEEDYEAFEELSESEVFSKTGRELTFEGSGIEAGAYSLSGCDFIIKVYKKNENDSLEKYTKLSEHTDVLVKTYGDFKTGSAQYIIQEKVKTFISNDVDLKENVFLDFYCELMKISKHCNVLDVHYANIGLDNSGALKIIDWGAFDLTGTGEEMNESTWFSNLRFDYRGKVNIIEEMFEDEDTILQ